MENNLAFYKEKFDMIDDLNLHRKRIEIENEELNFKNEEIDKKNCSLMAKIDNYKEKLSEEKNNSINFQLENSKLKTELDNVFQEKKDLAEVLLRKDATIQLLNSKIENILDEDSTPKNFKDSLRDIDGEFQNRFKELEKQKTINFDKE